MACGRIMVGSGTDAYDPICELPAGHRGSCKSSAAIGQHRLTVPAHDGSDHPPEDYYESPCDACGAEEGEPCRADCLQRDYPTDDEEWGMTVQCT